MKKEELISKYQMQKHPEGGYFIETYRSDVSVETPFGFRSASTAIFFLITKDSISHLHRLKSDEGWHFHMGDPLKIIEITPTGELKETLLGEGYDLQYFIPAGNWFASTSLGDYSFVGCTVAPGFDFADFEMAKKEELVKKFPHLKKTIETFALD